MAILALPLLSVTLDLPETDRSLTLSITYFVEFSVGIYSPYATLFKVSCYDYDIGCP